MINDIEQKTKKELAEIVRIQIEEYQKLAKDNERLIAERDGAVNLLERLTNGSNSRKQIIHLLGNADCFLDQLRQQAKETSYSGYMNPEQVSAMAKGLAENDKQAKEKDSE